MDSSPDNWRALAWAGGIILTLTVTLRSAIRKIVPLNQKDRELIEGLQRDLVESVVTLRGVTEDVSLVVNEVKELRDRISRMEGGIAAETRKRE